MNKAQNHQLEQLFNLPSAELEEATPEVVEQIEQQVQAADQTSDMQQRIDNALPQVSGIQHNDSEMDDIAKEALETYKDIKDLAMNVEARHAAELLSVAAGLLQTALDAKVKKTDSKLRTVSLQLQALRAQTKQAQNGVVETQGAVIGNRNQIMASLKNK